MQRLVAEANGLCRVVLQPTLKPGYSGCGFCGHPKSVIPF